MPLKKKLKKVVILGSGPIVIGQACEFDYSGTQACKALRQEGLEVILINSNPATIQTDQDVANKVYIEPLKVEFVVKVLEKEKPDAVIPTLGGQTALNLALELDASGILEDLKIELLGAKPEVIRKAEDRQEFCKVLDRVGASYPKSFMVKTIKEAQGVVQELGFPIVLRPNYTLGGTGGGIAYSQEEFSMMIAKGISESPTSEVLVEESILGWKEFELEVMRDCKGTFVVVCGIENFDPCGVHTGDSITVAPIQTLSEPDYQAMRTESCKIVNEVGVETGGANIQFAVCPKTHKRVVIEMNPRVSRSSALASKATGFPIAKIAALLAVGYELDEITNDITKTTPSCYEPALDYVVTKIPRFAFKKFPGAKDLLTTQMKSVGEVMGVGRTFKESFMKALASLEKNEQAIAEVSYSTDKVVYPNSERVYHLFQGLRDGLSVEELSKTTGISPWFLEQMEQIVGQERVLLNDSNFGDAEELWAAKKMGFTDARIAHLKQKTKEEIKKIRHQLQIRPTYQQVDTCAGEFQSETPYFYSSYWGHNPLLEIEKNKNSTVVVLGSGPNRIGQGIEFDYCCVRGVKRFQAQGHRVAMINSNPETVSTDYDTSDFLFFEPLTSEHVCEVLEYLKPKGFVAQLGGQTPINLAQDLVRNGFTLLGSSFESIDLAEDRSRFVDVCRELAFHFPPAGVAGGLEEALLACEKIGFPLICRPSYVLGGRRMEVVESLEELRSYFNRNGDFISSERPCFMDHFLSGALEVDVDLVRGKDWNVIGGVVEHIEAAGVHSGDSMGVLPPQRLKPDICRKMEQMSLELAERMDILGHLNLQLAIKEDQIFMIEANPRCSRSVPFVSKATLIPLVDLGVDAVLGKTSSEVKRPEHRWEETNFVSVKGVSFPFKKFREADSILGPEMKSTGESMGRGKDYAEALLKACLSVGLFLPLEGEVFLSLREKDKELLLPLVKKLQKMGYQFSATTGTARFLKAKQIPCETLKKVHEGRPHCVDRISSGQVAFVINTTSGRLSIEASFGIRRSCLDHQIPCLTESHAAEAFVMALEKQRQRGFEVVPLEPFVNNVCK